MNAKRTSTDGNGVVLTLISDSEKLELKDTNIKDFSSSDNLNVNNNSIDDAYVIIEGSDDNVTFKINRIHVNMTADDNYFVPKGGRLSEAIEEESGASAEPEVLFTENWDIAYLGLSNPSTQKIKLVNNDLNQYILEFVDGGGNFVSVPIATSPFGSNLLMGDFGKDFINRENLSISNDDYFIVTDGSRKRGERKTYILQYKGADKVTNDNPVLKFKDLGSGQTIEQTYSAGSGGGEQQLATLKIGGADFRVFNASSILQNDFNIKVDMDGNNVLNNDIKSNVIIITTQFGAEINITNQTGSNSILLSIKTPDDSRDWFAKDSVENLYPSVLVFNITASNGMVNHAKLGNLNFRTPDGQNNLEYAYTSYGTFIKREVPFDKPATLDIDYPSSQRLPIVYYETGGSQSKLLENLTQGDHSISIICYDIFDGIFDNYLEFLINFTDNDNDGIPDAEDMLLGNSSNINTSTINPIIEIDNSTNLSKKFSDTRLVKIKNNNKTLVEFEYNFSKDVLDLSNISVDIQVNSTNGMTIISLKGMPIVGTKTVYVDNLNNLTTLCIKDAKITSISQVSSSCNGANEYGIKCPGTANNDKYNCTFADETNSTFKIAGLTHSGVQQQSYCGDGIVSSGESCSNCPADAGSCPSTDGGSGGGSSSSGGGSGGGGGGGAFLVCNQDWQCSQWTTCVNDLQTRQCDFVKVPQHTQDSQCPTPDNPPTTSQTCEIKEEPTKTQSTVEAKTEVEQSQETKMQNQQNAITGGVVARILSNPKAAKELIIGAAVLVLVLGGIFGYRHIHKKPKKPFSKAKL